ncbi:glycoside hydrolase family 3 N-terminal domain-containing protein [Tessaracoccus antarcticus]|uniref:beta-glucosidase n=1 Tax=Tessaracoccus antarcticus TaxID=2479848 RepID=A0A3M0FXP3_9ACTN|nr:glycoside hydrolase family 3 N-terminal domain-containing protein [Tessaracoccus antarcticus]RMB57248.1 beta-glucosidase [Tessaracoccus antarcticus]
MSSNPTLPYLDPELSVHDRVLDLLGRMTVPEKIGQMMQVDARGDLDALVRERTVGSILHTSPQRITQAYELTQQTRLRIPLLVGEDCIHGHSFWPGATIFPTQLGMAASFNPELVRQVARATAIEVAATGTHWTFSPVLCVARDLRWGRVNETFGEDLHLIAELAVAMVEGYQGAGLDDPTAILATAKHFAGYSETQGGRDASEADISHRKMRSWFLPPFEAVARAGCATFMLGYQSTDGVPVTLNEWLLSEVLRGEWGYTGTLITDWDNVGRMVWEQQIQPDIAHAAAAATKAGNDMIMTTPSFFEGAQKALELGLLEPDAFDRAVARILTLKFEFGLFENPRLPCEERISTVVGTHQDLNLQVARESLVLLENDGTLPLSAPLKVAVVGPVADDVDCLLGDWAGASGQADMPNGQPRDMSITPLEGIRAIVAELGGAVTYARGADIVNVEPHPDGPHHPDGQPRMPVITSSPLDQSQLDDAVTIAEEADVVVAVVGDNIYLVGEGRSTATLNLMGGQNALLDAMVASGKPVVIVLLASKPLVLPASAEKAAAIIWAANPGMRGGQALAELLFGRIEPVGRLPISFARHVGQQPTYYAQIRGQHGDRYADLSQDPAWVFGEGKSYTTITYSNLTLDSSAPGREDSVVGRVRLTNTGSRPSRETVQAYIRDKMTSASWADRELKAFTHAWVQPGESIDVEVRVPVAECTIVDAAGNRIVEPGEFSLLVGPTSRPTDLLEAPFAVE